MDPLITHIAAAVRASRLQRGWTQLAEKLEMQPESVSNIERSASVPSLKLLIEISRVLDLNLGEVFTSAAAPRKAAKARADQEAKLMALARKLDEKHLSMLLEIAGVVERTA